MPITLTKQVSLQLYALGNLANVHLACGDLQSASTSARQAQDLAFEINQRDQYLEAMLTLGVCQRWEGWLPASYETLETTARWARLSQDRSREALALAELGRTLVAMGRMEEGRLRGKDALQIAIMTGTRRAEYAAQVALAESYLRSEEISDARYHATHAHELSKLIGQAYAHAESLLLIGEAAWLAHNEDVAQQSFSVAYDLSESLGARLLQIQAMLDLATAGMAIDITHLQELTADVASPLYSWRVWLTAGKVQETNGDLPSAEHAYCMALTVLASLRDSLRDEVHGGDTYLEARITWEPYERLVGLYTRQENTSASIDVVDHIDWPPLQAALQGGPRCGVSSLPC